MINLRLISLMAIVAVMATTVSAADSSCFSHGRFATIGRDAVLQKAPALIWSRCSVGQSWSNSRRSCLGKATSFTWKYASELASARGTTAEYWRLPKREELLGLVEKECSTSVKIDDLYFPNTPASYYWSTDRNESIPGHAWYVSLASGASGSANDRLSFHIRLVRDSY